MKPDKPKDRPEDQPMPAKNDRPSVQSMVIADIEAREQVGISRYGTALQPFNGRDALRDLYEELLDGAMYVKQQMIERDAKAESLRQAHAYLLDWGMRRDWPRLLEIAKLIEPSP